MAFLDDMAASAERRKLEARMRLRQEQKNEPKKTNVAKPSQSKQSSAPLIPYNEVKKNQSLFAFDEEHK